MTLGLKFLLCKNINFWFQKNSIQICIFNCNNVFLWDCMGKGACIKRMVAVRNYSTNTIMQKTNIRERRGGGRGGWLRIWNFQAGKIPKKLENFSGIAHSVLMPLGHFELHFWLCQPQTRKTTVVWWKEVSNKIFHSIYPVRLAIKHITFYNIAIT